MAFIPLPQGAKAVISYGVAFLPPISNTLWFHFASGVPAYSDLEALATALRTWWVGNVLDDLSEDIELFQIQVYGMESESSPVATVTSDATGSQTGDLASLASAAVVTFRTFNRGKSSRGRNYVSGWVESQVDGNSLLPGGVTAIQNAYEALPAVAIAEGFAHVVASFYTNGAPREEGIYTIVSEYEVRSGVFGAQRRRLFRD